jgi:lipopolysaccharide export system protein LptA
MLKTFLLLNFAFFSFSIFSQTKKTNPALTKLPVKQIEIISTKTLSYNDEKSDAQLLKGDVVFSHEGALLYCDSALLYTKQNRMEAGGHIVITKGDSIRVTGKKLFYDGKTKLATLQDSVTCTEKDMVLTTNLLTFDVANSVANYYDGGTIVNKENTLKSKNGHYYSAKKELAFHYDVELVNPDYTMRSDTLRYNTTNKTAYFLGPSIITSKTDYIYCQNGWYDTEKEKAQFSKNALLVTKQQKLTGDSLLYDRITQTGRAFRNIVLTDTSQKSIIYGNYAEFKQKKSEALVTKKALYARIIENDTLFIAADTLYHRDLDSVDNFLNAYHHVKLFKKDMQSAADSASLNTKDSLLQLFKTPLLWSNKSQAAAKTIKIFLGKNTVNGFKLEGNSFLISLADTLEKNDSAFKYNQLSGRTIEGFIKHDTIRKVIVSGNAEIYYYPKNKNKLMGLNKTTCSEIYMWLKNGEMDRVTFKPKTEGIVDPLKDIDIQNAKLKGFNWQYNKRPKSRWDLH